MVGTINPFSAVGDRLLAAEQYADGTRVRVPYQPDFWIEHAIREIYENYGDVIEFRPKSLLKFGQFLNLGTSIETVQAGGGTEIYATANTIDTVSSSDAGANTVVSIEGHTIDGSGEFTFVQQTATLNGQAKVVLSTPLARCVRIYNAGATEFLGDVHVYEDTAITGGVPSDETKIHATALAVDQQTEKLSTTIAKDEYWIISNGWASVNKKTTASVDFKLKVRQKGGVFRSRADLSVSNESGAVTIPFRPYFIVPQNADVRIDAVSSASGTSVSGGLSGILATVKVDN